MTAGSSHPGAQLPQPLRRARSGRWLGGVCAGMAARWGTPAGSIRALFAVAALFLGLGAIAYLACWLVLPAEDEEDGPSLLRGVASLALLAAACAGLLTVALAAGAATLFGFGWTVAVAAGVFLVGGLVAWPSVRPAWILLPLAAAAVPTVAVGTSGMRIEPSGKVQITVPRTPAELREGGYRAGLGDLLIDLRRFEAPAGAVVPIEIETGTGRTVVALPRGRCFHLDVRWSTGGFAWDALNLLARRRYDYGPSIVLYGQDQEGFDQGGWTRRSSDPDAPTLRIDFRSLDGELWVRDYPVEVGPLFEPYWPASVIPPPSPGELRWEWREEVRTPAVQRRWRAWEREMRAFERRMERLQQGTCAPREPAASTPPGRRAAPAPRDGATTPARRDGATTPARRDGATTPARRDGGPTAEPRQSAADGSTTPPAERP